MTTLAKQLKELRKGDTVVYRDGSTWDWKSNKPLIDDHGTHDSQGKHFYCLDWDIVRVIKNPRDKKADADVAWLLNFAKWPFGYTKKTQAINRKRLRAIAKRLNKETT